MSLAESFRHTGVAEAYRHRPPYPNELFDALERLLAPGPRHVLDLGCGDGALARPLAQHRGMLSVLTVSTVTWGQPARSA